jgi:hypothetical protein
MCATPPDISTPVLRVVETLFEHAVDDDAGDVGVGRPRCGSVFVPEDHGVNVRTSVVAIKT